jgi:hypothetical protein
MNKEELLINIEQFFILNQDDNRLLDSFKKQANKLFEKYEIKIPLENKSVDELHADLAKIDRAMQNKMLSDKAKILFEKARLKVIKRIEKIS